MYMFRAGIHTQMGGPYFRAGTNTGNGWVTLLRSKVLWLVCWFVDLLIVPTVFYMPINGLGARLKRVRSGDREVTCDCVDDQSLGRSCGTFPGSRACISRDLKVVEVSCDRTHVRSCDGFPGSCGWRVVCTIWLYIGLGVGLVGLGLGILCVRDIADSVLNRYCPGGNNSGSNNQNWHGPGNRAQPPWPHLSPQDDNAIDTSAIIHKAMNDKECKEYCKTGQCFECRKQGYLVCDCPNKKACTYTTCTVQIEDDDKSVISDSPPQLHPSLHK